MKPIMTSFIDGALNVFKRIGGVLKKAGSFVWEWLSSKATEIWSEFSEDPLKFVGEGAKKVGESVSDFGKEFLNGADKMWDDALDFGKGFGEKTYDFLNRNESELIEQNKMLLKQGEEREKNEERRHQEQIQASLAGASTPSSTGGNTINVNSLMSPIDDDPSRVNVQYIH